MEKETENIDSQNDEQENLDSEIEETEQSDDSEEESKEEYTEREKQYFARIKKLEKQLKDKEGGNQTPAKKSSSSELDITAKDTLAFVGAGVTDTEDIEEVVKLAKGFGMTVSEALKDDTVKHRLNVLAEQRKTADAANVKTSRSGAKKVDGLELKKKLSKGQVPDAGSTEAEELFWARRGGRRS